jgi:hypothetical protein
VKHRRYTWLPLGPLAQLVEQGTLNPKVAGSIPARPIILRGTGSLAEVAELLGHSKRSPANHYVYALTDYREIDRSIALACL